MNINNGFKLIILIFSYCGSSFLYGNSSESIEKIEFNTNIQLFDYQDFKENAVEIDGPNEQIQKCQDVYFNCAGQAKTTSDLMDCLIAHAICCNQVKL